MLQACAATQDLGWVLSMDTQLLLLCSRLPHLLSRLSRAGQIPGTKLHTETRWIQMIIITWKILFTSPSWSLSGDPTSGKKNHWCSWWASSMLWPDWTWLWLFLVRVSEPSSSGDFMKVSFLTCSAHQLSQKVGKAGLIFSFLRWGTEARKAACLPVSYPAGRGQKQDWAQASLSGTSLLHIVISCLNWTFSIQATEEKQNSLSGCHLWSFISWTNITRAGEYF